MDSDIVLARLRRFNEEREWGQFHTAENLAKSIVVEAGELLEHFQWGDPKPEQAQDIRHELADVLSYCFQLADRLGEDPNELILEKLAVTESKYPVEKSRGRSTKYDKL